MGIINAVHNADPGAWQRFFTGVNDAAYATRGGRLWLNSWYRDEDHNRKVGGSPESQHLFGTAIDVGGDEPALQDFARNIFAQGLVAVSYRNHVHVQLWPAGTARQLGLLRFV